MSGLMLVIGNKNYSSWSLRPWIFMKQNRIAFEEKRVALFTDTTNAELAQYDSDFKVPVLVDGNLIVWDSLAILEYLSERYLDHGGWPRKSAARAMARSVSAEMHSSFFNVRNELPMNCRKRFRDIKLSAQAQHEVDRIQRLWRKCRENFGEGGQWLFGSYSIADAMFAPVTLRFEGYGIHLDDVGRAYVRHTLSQPAMIEWMEAGRAEKEIIDADEIADDTATEWVRD